MSDADTTIETLRQAVRAFVAEREWQKLHTPKNLVMSLAIEAAELMEHFQWLDPAESHELAASPESKAEVADELADVLCYALSLANTLQIDVSSAVLGKLRKNALKYPTERYRGRFRADDADDRPAVRS
jgi:NTP pyrophosphatase (non-canonical NTP hydrolase)